MNQKCDHMPLVNNKLNIILAPSGAGKTFFIKQNPLEGLIDADDYPPIAKIYAELIAEFGSEWWTEIGAYTKKGEKMEQARINCDLVPESIILINEPRFVSLYDAVFVVMPEEHVHRAHIRQRILKGGDYRPIEWDVISKNRWWLTQLGYPIFDSFTSLLDTIKASRNIVNT